MSNTPADLPDPTPPTGRNDIDLPPARHMLVIGYDGTGYHGWQKQAVPEGTPPIRTVAEEIEQALVRLYKQPIRLVGASRTDAGVHALGQVAHYDAVPRIPTTRIPLALNSRLSPEIEIVSARHVPPGFDAITDAVRKQYRYRVFHSHRRPLHRRNQVYHCTQALDLAQMRAAARMIEGEHDFAGFTVLAHGRTTTVRTVFSCTVELAPEEVHIVVVGSGFLYNMVRIIAGTLVDVGRGRRTLAQVADALEKQHRPSAGETLPPEGLCLEWIEHRGLPPINPDDADTQATGRDTGPVSR